MFRILNALLLNVIAPGAGLALSGWLRHAWCCFLAFWLLLVCLVLSRWLIQPHALWLLALPFIVSSVYTLSVQPTPRCRAARRLRHAGSMSLVGLALLAAAISFRSAVLGVQFYFIPSASMAPTLLPGDFIAVDTWAYQQRRPAAGEIIVFKQHDDLHVIKRCATWPNSRQVLTNGELYLLGDNPQASLDSRRLGGIALQRVQGQAIYRLAHWDATTGRVTWPLQALGQTPAAR